MAAEDDVELVSVGRGVHEVGAGEMDDGAQFGPGDPCILGLVEPAQHGLGLQAALDLEAGIGAGPGLLQRALRQVGGHDFDRDPGFLGGDGQGPGLLARGAAGGPDLDRLAAAGLAEGGQQFLAEGVETVAIAPEPGLGVEQGLDHRPAQAGHRFGPERSQHGVDRLEPFASGHGAQTVFGQLHPVARQPKARARGHQ